MKKVFLFFYLFTFLSCANVSSQDEISPAEFEKKLAAQQSQLLDVRTAGEYQSGHLKNSLQADWLNQEQFADRVKYLDKSKPLLVYCASGIRSAAAAKWLLNNGFTNVQNLKGGLTSWKLEGRPMEGADDKTQMGIDDYNQLTKSNQVVLVDFGAEWCPPCKKMEPVLQRLQKELPNQFKLVKVDGGDDLEVMKAQKVDAIPVFIIYKNGKEVWRKQGVVAFAELKQQLAL
ncbi:MAG: thioredoxin domain-containing protein [Chitinophagaceae bacterium]|nr:thioredoxin domain-containing protein [Chitinophagaceae bacterium]MDP1812619.1 thioredoxin domain-containing protein [Sediminibacterium sp.]MDP3127506.1 thioredoxin domain-containing protein [Sediminibacterium sp.]